MVSVKNGFAVVCVLATAMVGCQAGQSSQESDSTTSWLGQATPLREPDHRFEEDFADVLQEGWEWLGADAEAWTLERHSDWLSITAHDGLSVNGLARSAPPGPFGVSTALRFQPDANYQLAGLVALGEDVDDLVQLGRAFCDTPDACVGDGLYFNVVFGDYWYYDENFATDIGNPQLVYLRLLCDGESCTAEYSDDNEQWTTLGTHEVPFRLERVGVIAHQGESVVADFDWFTMWWIDPAQG